MKLFDSTYNSFPILEIYLKLSKKSEVTLKSNELVQVSSCVLKDKRKWLSLSMNT